MQKGLKDTGPP